MQNNIINKQLNRMRELMKTNTITEAQKKAQDPVEYSTMGPDGNYYGIVREGAKYYIKSAKPNEKGQLIKEHLDYIGGFLERRQNEYNSFASAKRNLEGKLYSLNEAIKSHATLVECNTNKAKSKRIIIEAKGEIRADIKRQLEIMNNSQVLDESRAGYRSMNALINEEDTPDNSVFTKDAEGDAFGEDGQPKMCEKGVYSPEKCNGKAISTELKEAEDDEDVIDEEPAEDEKEDDAEMDLGDGVEDADLDAMEDGSEIDDFDTEDAEGEEGDDTVLSADEDGEGDDLEDDFEEKTYTIFLDPSDLEGGEDINLQIKVGDSDETGEFDDDSLYGDELGDEEGTEDDLGADDLGDDEEGAEEGAEPDFGEDEEETVTPMESRNRRGKMLREANYFGKHPKYLAKPFTTPRAHQDFENTYDWNDESVDNEDEPFTDNQRYKYFSERPKHIENSLGLAEGRIRRSKKAQRRF